MKTFYTVWLGQVLSAFGSNQTAFAIGLWLFQSTGSVTMFSAYMFAAILPGVVLSPILGAWVDRLDRRQAMLIADIGAGVITVILALLLWFDILATWQLFTISAIKSIFTAMQRPAYTAATSVLVDKDKLGKASGLVQLSFGLAQILAPALGGVLFLAIGLEGIIVIDFVTFVIAVVTLSMVKFPVTPRSETGEAAKGTIMSEAAFGFGYMKQRPGLLGLLWYLAGVNFFVGMLYALATPAILLSFDNDTVILGTLLSVAGCGMLCGSILMSVWGGPKQKIKGVLGFSILIGLGLLLVAIKPFNPVVLGIFVFMTLFGAPLVIGCNQVIWQKKVPFDVQGKVFGVRQMAVMLSIPLAYLVAGPLADNVFEPFMASGHELVQWIQLITGKGPGSGIRLMFLLSGSLMFLMLIWAYRSTHMKYVEAHLPDADEEVPAQAT